MYIRHSERGGCNLPTIYWRHFSLVLSQKFRTSIFNMNFLTHYPVPEFSLHFVFRAKEITHQNCASGCLTYEIWKKWTERRKKHPNKSNEFLIFVVCTPYGSSFFVHVCDCERLCWCTPVYLQNVSKTLRASVVFYFTFSHHQYKVNHQFGRILPSILHTTKCTVHSEYAQYHLVIGS